MRKALSILVLILHPFITGCYIHPVYGNFFKGFAEEKDDNLNLLALLGLLMSWQSANTNANRTVNFTTGQAASVVVGQGDFSSVATGRSQTLFGPGLTGSPAVSQGRLYLPDYGNQRILGYHSIPTVNGAPADFVIGANDFTALGNLNSITGIHLHTEKLMVAYNVLGRRVGIWNSIPTATTSANPDYVISGAVEPVHALVGFQVSVSTAMNKLLISDEGNNRVLLWNSIPVSDGVSPDLVFGQPDVNSNTGNNGGISATSLYWPYDVATDGNRVVVSDLVNNRVLIWNSWPTTNGQPADVVLGQSDFNSDLNPGTASASNFVATGLFLYENKLIVTDNRFTRYLIFEGSY